MDPWLIVVVALAVSVVWYATRRANRAFGPHTGSGKSRHDRVEEWYGETQEAIFAMDDDERQSREHAWGAMSDADRIDFSEAFISNRFRIDPLRTYSRDEKLKIGRAAFITRDPHARPWPEP